MYAKNLNRLVVVLGLAGVVALGVVHVQATSTGGAEPQVIPFQGHLTDASGQPVPDGPVEITFSLYHSAEGSETVWGETHSAVNVRKGGFEVELGNDRFFADPDRDPTTNNAVDFSRPLYLGIKVANDAEMRPRRRIIPPFFARSAESAKQAEFADRAGVAAQATHHSNIIPVGCIMAFWGTTAPEGWLLCNGTDISSNPLYATLRSMVGDKTPDLQGMFLRGAGQNFDARYRYPGDGERQVGMPQEGATMLPSGVRADNAGEHSHRFLWPEEDLPEYSDRNKYPIVGGPEFQAANSWGAGVYIKRQGPEGMVPIGNDGLHGHTLSGGGPETRPNNVAVSYIIKY